MSQRTPSHWCAMRESSPSIACWSAGLAVVQLERVRPAREVRIAAVSEDPASARGFDATVVLRLGGEELFRYPPRTIPGARQPRDDPPDGGTASSTYRVVTAVLRNSLRHWTLVYFAAPPCRRGLLFSRA